MNKTESASRMSVNVILGFMAFASMLSFAAIGVTAYPSPATVDLGAAENFRILAYAGITNVPTSSVTGNVGAYPIGGSAIGLTCGEVSGTIYAADVTGPLCQVVAAPLLNIAMNAIGTAYTDATSRAASATNPGSAGEIGGLTLAPGVYAFTGSSINALISTDLALDCGGDTKAIFIFQIPGTFDVATGAQVNLINGCQAKNVFWAVGGATTLHESSVLEGNILAATSIAMQSLATLHGRAFSRTESVTLIANTILLPADTTDTTPPVLTVLGTNPVNVTEDAAYIDAGATALDAVSGSASVLSSGAVDTTVIGTYTITYSATDSSENTATATRTVNVVAASNQTGGNQTGGNETGGTETPQEDGDLSIAPWFPQEDNYVFVCDPDFTATSYDWDFADGEKMFDVANANVWHSYTAEGVYEISCTATDGVRTQVYLLKITVGDMQSIPSSETSVSLNILPWFPQGENGEVYVFSCDAAGFSPQTFDWDFGDGQKLHDVQNVNVWHAYADPGDYAVECSATNGETTEMGEIHINVAGTQEDPTVLEEATLSVAPWFPQGLSYVFQCEEEGFTAATYSWDFGDGQKMSDVANNNVWHTFSTPGEYRVECAAKDDTGRHLAKDTLKVNAVDDAVLIE